VQGVGGMPASRHPMHAILDIGCWIRIADDGCRKSGGWGEGSTVLRVLDWKPELDSGIQYLTSKIQYLPSGMAGWGVFLL